MPRYFFSRTPSAKKYSPGASVVAASNEPIITKQGSGVRISVFGTWIGAQGMTAFSSPQLCDLTSGCSQRERLDHMAHSLNATVSDDWHAEAPGVLRYLVHRGPLGPPACHDWRNKGDLRRLPWKRPRWQNKTDYITTDNKRVLSLQRIFSRRGALSNSGSLVPMATNGQGLGRSP